MILLLGRHRAATVNPPTQFVSAAARWGQERDRKPDLQTGPCGCWTRDPLPAVYFDVSALARCRMIEMTIHGRGGQGGVTLAKLIATSYFLRGRFTQAFGVYAAERSGAPLAAFVRIDTEEILNHNQVRTPDHVIVLDRTLIGPNVAFGMKEGGWIILNTPEPPEAFAEQFGGRRVAAIDATSLALAHSLGTKSVPIVNTTMLGAVLKVLGEPWESAAAALDDLRFGGANVEVAREAFEKVRGELLTGKPHAAAPPGAKPPPMDILDERIGAPSSIRTGSWATRSPHRRQLLSPCANACPAGNDIQGFVGALNDSNPDEALAILLETSPLPGVCGRVCPAPCMSACNRSYFDEPVQIRELERFAAEHGRRPETRRAGRRRGLRSGRTQRRLPPRTAWVSCHDL